MLGNVLVTLDGSPYSEAVLPVVVELVAGTGAEVTLFSVGETPSATAELAAAAPVVPRPDVFTHTTTAYPTVAPYYAETKTQAIERREHELEEYLEEKAKPLRDRGIEVRVAVVLGHDAADLIIEYARGHPVDLVVMATHGHTGLRSLIFEADLDQRAAAQEDLEPILHAPVARHGFHDPPPLDRLGDGPGDGCQIGLDGSLEVEGQMGIGDQVGVPVASAGGAADDDHPLDVVKHELDPSGPPGSATGGRDVDPVWACQGPLDAFVEVGCAHDGRKVGLGVGLGGHRCPL